MKTGQSNKDEQVAVLVGGGIGVVVGQSVAGMEKVLG